MKRETHYVYANKSEVKRQKRPLQARIGPCIRNEWTDVLENVQIYLSAEKKGNCLKRS